MANVHISVLTEEVINGLNIHEGDVILDGTLGGAGHSFEIAKRFPKVKIIGLDLDQDALSRSEGRLKEAKADFVLYQSNFRDLDSALAALNIPSVDKILLDIGLSSNQFESSGRGFSFQKNEPLLMTFKAEPEEGDLTAAKIVNSWPEAELAKVIYEYGEERYSRQIAKAIVEARRSRPIITTLDLVSAIESAVPKSYRHGRINPATKTFQALRIAVNDELNNLKLGLIKGFEKLMTGGRLAVISFHSLEDRIVKNYFKELAKAERGLPISKKPIVPTDEEIKNNPRSRSAKLRIIEKLI
ncbi:MAG: 16S rRNA (cytosine(1402)-N(4))-methyltransferase RsmH [Candidatus Paceibacterota bacterium]|jgi:16S rRNA (cytosine1402-N4)-methyltransferase